MFHSPGSAVGHEDKRHRRSMDLTIHDEEEVDIEIGMSTSKVSPSPALRKSTSMKNIGLGLPSAFTTLSGFTKDKEQCMDSGNGDKRPSPPPAYGPLLSGSGTGRDEGGLGLGLGLGLGVAINTPPTQDIEHDSPNAYFSRVQAQAQDLDFDLEIELDPAQELQLRRRRATDAAEAIGLQLEFSPETEGQQAGDDIDALGEEEIRQQLRIMKRQLDLRDNGKSAYLTGRLRFDADNGCRDQHDC